METKKPLSTVGIVLTRLFVRRCAIHNRALRRGSFHNTNFFINQAVAEEFGMLISQTRTAADSYIGAIRAELLT
jgi:hypothetical protein